MKKLFFFMACLLASTTMFAETVTFVAGTDKTATADETSLTKSGITLTATTFNNASYYQAYKGQKLTVASTVGNITKIEITCTAANENKYGPGSFAAQEGYTYEEKVGTWIGDAESVTFTASANQVRMTQIVVTYTAADPTAPVISADPSSLDFGTYLATEAPAERTITITAKNVGDAGILVDVAEGFDYFTVSEEELPAEGGELTITCIATEVGVYEGVLYLTDDNVDLEVALKAEVLVLVGDGTKDNPYTVADVLDLNNTKTGSYWITGYIIGANDNGTVVESTTTVNSNIVIAATAETAIGKFDVTKHVTVQLPSGDIRTALNLKDNAGNLGKKVKLYGDLMGYFSSNPGMKNTSEYEWVSDDTTALENTGAETIKARKVIENGQIIIIKDGVRYNVLGAEL